MQPTQKYVVRDNGVRCFVPPCYSWDVINGEGETTSVCGFVVCAQRLTGQALDRLSDVGTEIEGRFVQVGDERLFEISDPAQLPI